MPLAIFEGENVGGRGTCSTLPVMLLLLLLVVVVVKRLVSFVVLAGLTSMSCDAACAG